MGKQPSLKKQYPPFNVFIFIIMVFVDSLFSFSSSEIGMVNPPTLMVTRIALGWALEEDTWPLAVIVKLVLSAPNMHRVNNNLHSKRIFSYFFIFKLPGSLRWPIAMGCRLLLKNYWITNVYKIRYVASVG